MDLPFWSKKKKPQSVLERNPFRALNPELFDTESPRENPFTAPDRGEKIITLARELQRVANSRRLTDADTITALQTALGGELAAALRRNPTWPPEQNALSATAKAAGLIIGNIVADRPGVSAEELNKLTQNAVAEFAQAITFQASQKK